MNLPLALSFSPGFQGTQLVVHAELRAMTDRWKCHLSDSG